MNKIPGRIRKKYLSIKNARHTLTNNEFNVFCYILKNNNSYVNVSDAKKRYNYIKNIYNNNTILQDNISYLAFLKEFAKYNYENIVKLRMFEILDIFNVDYNFYKVKTNIDSISSVSDTEIITNEISVLEKIENIGNKITFTIEDIFKDETKNEYKLLVQLHSELLNKKTKCFNVTSPELDEESIVNCIKKELDLMKKMIDFKENTTGEIQRI